MKVWVFTLQAWQLAIPALWLVGALAFGAVANKVFGIRLPWWVYLLGFPIAVLISAGRSNIIKRLWVFLGVPYLLRKKSTESTGKPLTGTGERWFYRLGNALGLAIWTTWPIYVAIRVGDWSDEFVITYAIAFFLLVIVDLTLIRLIKIRLDVRVLLRLGGAVGLAALLVWPLTGEQKDPNSYLLFYTGAFLVLYTGLLTLADRFVLFKKSRLALFPFVFLWVVFVVYYIQWEYKTTGRCFSPWFLLPCE